MEPCQPLCPRDRDLAKQMVSWGSQEREGQTQSKLSGWECQGWEAEVLNLSLSSRVNSVSKQKKKKRPSLESKDILTTKSVSVMLIFTDASQVSEKACLTKAQRTQGKTESG